MSGNHRNSLHRAALAAVLLALLGASAATAHVADANLERGFSADQVYQFDDLDSVNLFNGNLTLSLPIGPSYPVGGSLSYQLQLVYGSQIWDYEYICSIENSPPAPFESSIWSSKWLLEEVLAEPDPEDSTVCSTIAIPNRKSNAGTGWTLGFEQLYAPRSGGGFYGAANVNQTVAWVYVSPDAAEHAFFVSLHGTDDGTVGSTLYTRDGTFLRLTHLEGSSTAQVETPDGLVHTFTQHQHSQAAETHWRLTKIEDPFGNSMSIDYVDEAPALDVDDSDLHWDITDSTGRQHKVELLKKTFDVSNDTSDPDVELDGVTRTERIAHYVELAAPGGGFSRYDFETTRAVVLRGCPNTWGYGNFSSQRNTGLVQLASVKQPDGTRFDFGYEPQEDETVAICSRSAGRLNRIDLPTGGAIEYEYSAYVAPRNQDCLDLFHLPLLRSGLGARPQFIVISNQAGILKRRVYENPGAGVTATRTYLHGFLGDWMWDSPDGVSCDLPKTAFTAVIEPPTESDHQNVTLNFFSIFNGIGTELAGDGTEEPGFDQVGWSPSDYAAPFTRESRDSGSGESAAIRLPELAVDPADPSRFISREVYDCPFDPDADPAPDDPLDPDGSPVQDLDLRQCELKRRLFVSYERDVDIDLCNAPVFSADPDCTLHDRRLKDESTRFVGDNGCVDGQATGPECFAATVRSDYDGLGHYRQEDSIGNFGNPPNDPTRRVVTRFNPGVTFDPADPASFQTPQLSKWILGTYDLRTSSQVDGPGETFVEHFRFDPDTGFLELHKQDRGAQPTPFETTFLPDANGNVATEQYTGGDDGNGSQPDYEIHHVYTSGVLTRSDYVDPADGRTVLRFVDRDVDPNTGLVIASRDSAQAQTDFGYDSMWRLASVTPVETRDASTSYEYFPAQLPESGAQVRVRTHRRPSGSGTGIGGSYCTDTITVPEDVLTQEEYEYDGLGRVAYTRTWMPGGQIAEVATEYSPQGWVTRQTTPYDACAPNLAHPATVTRYDVFGRPLSIVPPDGSFASEKFMKLVYTAGGVREKKRQVHGVGSASTQIAETSFRYDHRGRLHYLIDATGGRWRYRRDQAGNLLEVAWAASAAVTPEVRRSFVYDGAGLLLSESHPELGLTLYHKNYDARGLAHARRFGTSAAGTPFDLDYTYDPAGRLVQTKQHVTGKLLTEMFYGTGGGTGGKLVRSKRHNYLGPDIVVSKLNFFDGPSHRLSRQVLVTGGDGFAPRTLFETAYQYDALGNLSRVDYPGCDAYWCFEPAGERDETIGPLRSAQFGYDAGRLSKVGELDAATAGGFKKVAAIQYYRDGLIAGVAHLSNGTADAVADDPYAMGRPLSMSAVGPGGTPLWSSGDYVYDTAGNVTGIGSDTYDYDLLDRLTGADVSLEATTVSQSFGYDEFGNMRYYGDTTRLLSPDRETNRTSGWLYDDAGNVLATVDYGYQWDPLGAMTRATKSNGEYIDVLHLYDAAGERVAILHLSTEGTTRELWSLRGPDDRILRDVEYLPQTVSTVNGTTTLDGGWRWLKDYVYRGDGLLASFGATAAESERHYHLDHLGTPRAITDAFGSRASLNKYLPFGEQIDVPVDITTERLRFTGHERDDLGPAGQVSDLDYMHARYYRPLRARFLSVDPLGGEPERPQSWNRYSYVMNRPGVWTDPTGLQGGDCTSNGDGCPSGTGRAVPDRNESGAAVFHETITVYDTISILDSRSDFVDFTRSSFEKFQRRQRFGRLSINECINLPSGCIGAPGKYTYQDFFDIAAFKARQEWNRRTAASALALRQVIDLAPVVAPAPHMLPAVVEQGPPKLYTPLAEDRAIAPKSKLFEGPPTEFPLEAPPWQLDVEYDDEHRPP